MEFRKSIDENIREKVSKFVIKILKVLLELLK